MTISQPFTTLLMQAKTRILYQILSRLDFAPFYKSVFCSSKHEISSNYLVSFKRRDPKLSIHRYENLLKIFRKI